jgi:hypothetical protein
LFLCNRRVPGFRFEKECRAYVAGLKRKWDGSVSPAKPKGRILLPRNRRPVRIQPVMISCAERDGLRRQTLANFERTDWEAPAILLQMDAGAGDDRVRRQADCSHQALRQGFNSGADYVLFLEDDLDFNRHLWRNLHRWPPVRDRALAMASLYNPGIRYYSCDVRSHARLARPNQVYGSQAFLLARRTVAFLLRNWTREAGCQDIRISRLVGRLHQPILYHAPSLVQHVGFESVWGGGFHEAWDFDAHWRAPA